MTGNAQYSWFWFCAPLVNDANVHPCGIDTRAYCAYFKINVSTLAEEVMKAYTFFSFSSKFLFFSLIYGRRAGESRVGVVRKW